jgi:hypothetical protein
MSTNPILDALHETRERLLLESGGTLAGLVERLQAEEKASGRRMWTSPQTGRCPATTNDIASTLAGQSTPNRDR